VPQSWLEFDVEDVAAASAVLKGRGYRLLVDNRTEPWPDRHASAEPRGHPRRDYLHPVAALMDKRLGALTLGVRGLASTS